MGYFDDMEQAPPGALEMALLKRRKMLEELSKRNLSQMQMVGGQMPTGPNARRELGLLNGHGAQAAVAPEVPAEMQNPLDNVAARGGQIMVSPTAADRNARRAMGTSELRGATPSMDVTNLQRQLADPAYVAARNAQGDAARAKQNEAGFHRMTHKEIVKARQEASLAMMQKYQMAAIQPQLALIAASKGLDPLQQAHANYYNAQAQAWGGGQGAQAQPGQAGVPGVPEHSPPPGAPSTESYMPPSMRAADEINRRPFKRRSQEKESQMDWLDFAYRPIGPSLMAPGQRFVPQPFNGSF